MKDLLKDTMTTMSSKDREEAIEEGAIKQEVEGADMSTDHALMKKSLSSKGAEVDTTQGVVEAIIIREEEALSKEGLRMKRRDNHPDTEKVFSLVGSNLIRMKEKEALGIEEEEASRDHMKIEVSKKENTLKIGLNQEEVSIKEVVVVLSTEADLNIGVALNIEEGVVTTEKVQASISLEVVTGAEEVE